MPKFIVEETVAVKVTYTHYVVAKNRADAIERMKSGEGYTDTVYGDALDVFEPIIEVREVK